MIKLSEFIAIYGNKLAVCSRVTGLHKNTLAKAAGLWGYEKTDKYLISSSGKIYLDKEQINDELIPFNIATFFVRYLNKGDGANKEQRSFISMTKEAYPWSSYKMVEALRSFNSGVASKMMAELVGYSRRDGDKSSRELYNNMKKMVS